MAVTDPYTGGGGSGGNLSTSMGNMGTNVYSIGPPPFNFPPATGTDTPWVPPTDLCKLGHLFAAESSFEVEDGIMGHCQVCGDLMKVQSIPGGLPYLRAGRLVGEAMSLDDESAGLPALLGDLSLLDAALDREIKKLRHAKRLITLSRSIAAKKAIANAETIVATD